MEPQTEKIIAGIDCEECRRHFSALLSNALPSLLRWQVERHLARCQECADYYSQLTEEEEKKTALAEPRFGGRPVWGPLEWNGTGTALVEEIATYLVQRPEQEKTARRGRVAFLEVGTGQEKQALVLQLRIEARLKKEGKIARSLFFAPEELLDEQQWTGLPRGSYLIVHRTAPFALVLERAYFLTERGISLLIAGSRLREDDLLPPVTYRVFPFGSIPSPELQHRLREEFAAVAQLLASAEIASAYRYTCLLDALGTPMPLALLARLLGCGEQEARRQVLTVPGLLAVVERRSAAPAHVVSKGPYWAQAVVAQEFPDEAVRLDWYQRIIGGCQSEETETVFRLFEELVRAGQKRMALALLERSEAKVRSLIAATHSPRQLLAWGKILKGLNDEQQRGFHLAHAAFERGKQLDPNNVYLLYAYAVMLGERPRREGQYKKALQVFAQALRLDQENVYVLHAWGDMHRKKGNLRLADEYLRRALRRDPPNVPILVSLALVRKDQKQHDRAQKLLDQALQIEPKNPMVLVALADVLTKQGKWREAVANAQQALSMHPANVPARNLLGRIAKDQGHWQEARKYLDEALALEPENLHCLHLMGELCFEEGKFLKRHDEFSQAEEKVRAAERRFLQVLSLEPTNVHTLVALGALYSEERHFEKAEQKLQEARTLEGDTPFIYGAWGNMELRRGNVSRAKRLFQEVLDMDRANVVALNSLAQVSAREGNRELALRYLKHSREIEPRNVRTFNTWAEIERECGSSAEEIQRILKEQSLAIDQDNAYTHQAWVDLLPEDPESAAHKNRAKELRGVFA